MTFNGINPTNVVISLEPKKTKQKKAAVSGYERCSMTSVRNSAIDPTPLNTKRENRRNLSASVSSFNDTMKFVGLSVSRRELNQLRALNPMSSETTAEDRRVRE